MQLWQHFSNWDHPHSALVGKTPIDRYRELLDRTPLHEEVAGAYHPANARIREQSYAVDMALAALRRSV